MVLDPRDYVTGLFGIIGAYFMYDKTRTTKRLDDHQERLRELEHKTGVIETKLDGLREILDIKFDMVMEAIKDNK